MDIHWKTKDRCNRLFQKINSTNSETSSEYCKHKTFVHIEENIITSLSIFK
jgi:hypothetical protein